MPDVRLIDANALIKDIAESIRLADEWEIESHKKQDKHGLKYAIDTRRSLLAMISRVKDAPTIDAQPIIHAHWIMLNKQVGQCSNCGYCQESNGIDKTGNGGIHKAVYRWCAICGAKMDGGDADEQH